MVPHTSDLYLWVYEMPLLKLGHICLTNAGSQTAHRVSWQKESQRTELLSCDTKGIWLLGPNRHNLRSTAWMDLLRWEIEFMTSIFEMTICLNSFALIKSRELLPRLCQPIWLERFWRRSFRGGGHWESLLKRRATKKNRKALVYLHKRRYQRYSIDSFAKEG